MYFYINNFEKKELQRKNTQLKKYSPYLDVIDIKCVRFKKLLFYSLH